LGPDNCSPQEICRLKPWNRLLGLYFHSVADILAAYETVRDIEHCAAINNYFSFSKVFPLSEVERQFLAQKGIYIFSKLMDCMNSLADCPKMKTENL
jgi:hypothetical protein